MKMIATALGFLLIHSVASATSVQFGEVLKCKVESISGNLISFLPPEVGDEIKIDASRDTIDDLTFTNRNMIPVQKPLIKNAHKDTASYMVFFQADQFESNSDKGSLTVMVGKFRDENGKDVYSAQIQQIVLEKHSGLIDLSEAKLNCQPM